MGSAVRGAHDPSARAARHGLVDPAVVVVWTLLGLMALPIEMSVLGGGISLI